MAAKIETQQVLEAGEQSLKETEATLQAKGSELTEVIEKLKTAPSANDEAQDAAVMAKAEMKTACKDPASSECRSAERNHKQLDAKAQATAADLAKLTSSKPSLEAQ